MRLHNIYDWLLADIDNTLYNWIDYFVPAFSGMVNVLSRMTGISVSLLIDDFAAVYRRHGSVEYSFALEELEQLKVLHPTLGPTERVNLYWDAVEAFQTIRRQKLVPYPGIDTLLGTLLSRSVQVVGVTESTGFDVAARLRWLKLDKYFSALYTIPEHSVPSEVELHRIRRHPPTTYQPSIPVKYLPDGLHKPNPAFLEFVIADLNVGRSKVVYLGDSLRRDVQMARRSGIDAIWARYGTLVDSANLNALLRITPWTQEDLGDDENGSLTSPYTQMIADRPIDVLQFFQ